jgi:hypothetical protein
MASFRKWTIPTERPPLVCEVSAKFCEETGCHVASAAETNGRILDFLDRSRYFFFQVAHQIYSRGGVDHVPDPILLRKTSFIVESN